MKGGITIKNWCKIGEIMTILRFWHFTVSVSDAILNLLFMGISLTVRMDLLLKIHTKGGVAMQIWCKIVENMLIPRFGSVAAAILDAILDFSKCPMMPAGHHVDPESTQLPLPESAKNSLGGIFCKVTPKMPCWLPDY